MNTKLVALVLALCVSLSLLTACGSAPAAKQDSADAQPEVQTVPLKMGMLSMLNTEKEEAAAYVQAREYAAEQLTKEGYCTARVPGLRMNTASVFYYDTLELMLLGLNSGEIDILQTYQTIAGYLCSMNDDLVLAQEYDTEKERNAFAEATLSGVLANDFAFLMMADHEELRDEFNEAILAMKEDGTLARLLQEQITDVLNGEEIRPAAISQTEGAETIRVAVTGALPPMDYAAPDGSPAGFSTAVLAEIGRRIGKNIALLVVDSIGRAAALASGTVDVVFWTRTNDAANAYANMTLSEREASRRQLVSEMTEEEAAVISRVEASADYSRYGLLDAPNGTIMTESYFTDVIVPVVTREFAESRNRV